MPRDLVVFAATPDPQPLAPLSAPRFQPHVNHHTSPPAHVSRTTDPPRTTIMSLPPNQSLYLTNLPDKLLKRDLRLSLYTLFSTYGVVLDVVALKTPKCRGQAHVVFRDIAAATQAMRALQAFVFFGKPMVRCNGILVQGDGME